MAFNLSAQLFLQSPSTQQIDRSLNNINKSLDKGTKKANTFSDSISLKTQSFAAYTIASAAVLKLTNAISRATTEAIKLDKELAKISQIINISVDNARALSTSILDISVAYGVSANKVAETIRVLTQSGLAFEKARKTADLLAKTTLLATFDSLASTTEGLVAIFSQFNLSVRESEVAIGAINALSKRYAVESGDLIEAVKRAGGVFSATGSSLNDLLAIFTTVRSTTRETSETIATGLRTIFSRLQRPKTIEYFRELGIELTDLKGGFIGNLPAIERISAGLERLGINAGDVRFAEVVEQLGGIRQSTRVIPLLTQQKKLTDTVALANQGLVETDEDVAKAKQTLAFRIEEVRAKFAKLLVEITQSQSFQILTKTLIGLADSLISVASALKPLIPLITAFTAIKVGNIAGQTIRGISGGRGPLGLNTGGMVPGSGNGDTVPAMLEPGEFVIRKRAVQAFGSDKLAQINKYNRGGKTKGFAPKNVSDPKLRYERFGRFKDTELGNEKIYYKDVDTYGLERPVAGGLKGVMYEKYMRRRFNVNANGKDSAFPDISSSKAFSIVKAAGLKPKVGNKQLDGAELKYRLNSDSVFNYRKGLRRSKRALNVPMIFAEGQKFAKGGPVGEDRVPSLLTPGEFVINKKSAQSFGYDKLNKINKYNKGGRVGFQKFQTGGIVSAGSPGTSSLEKLTTVAFAASIALSALLRNFGDASSETTKKLDTFAGSLVTSSLLIGGAASFGGKAGSKIGLSLFGKGGGASEEQKELAESTKEVKTSFDDLVPSLQRMEESLAYVAAFLKEFVAEFQRSRDGGSSQKRIGENRRKLTGSSPKLIGGPQSQGGNSASSRLPEKRVAALNALGDAAVAFAIFTKSVKDSALVLESEKQARLKNLAIETGDVQGAVNAANAQSDAQQTKLQGDILAPALSGLGAGIGGIVGALSALVPGLLPLAPAISAGVAKIGGAIGGLLATFEPLQGILIKVADAVINGLSSVVQLFGGDPFPTLTETFEKERALQQEKARSEALFNKAVINFDKSQQGFSNNLKQIQAVGGTQEFSKTEDLFAGQLQSVNDTIKSLGSQLEVETEKAQKDPANEKLIGDIRNKLNEAGDVFRSNLSQYAKVLRTQGVSTQKTFAALGANIDTAGNISLNTGNSVAQALINSYKKLGSSTEEAENQVLGFYRSLTESTVAVKVTEDAIKRFGENINKQASLVLQRTSAENNLRANSGRSGTATDSRINQLNILNTVKDLNVLGKSVNDSSGLINLLGQSTQQQIQAQTNLNAANEVAREKELVTLTLAKNQNQNLVSVTKALVAEKKNELQAVKNSSAQYYDLLESQTFATNEQKRQLDEQIRIGKKAATVGVKNLKGDERQQALEVFKRFGDLEIFNGQTGKEAIANNEIITLQNILGRRLTDTEKERVRSQSTPEQVRIAQKIFELEDALIRREEALVGAEEINNQVFGQATVMFRDTVDNFNQFLNDQAPKAPVAVVPPNPKPIALNNNPVPKINNENAVRRPQNNPANGGFRPERTRRTKRDDKISIEHVFGAVEVVTRIINDPELTKKAQAKALEAAGQKLNNEKEAAELGAPNF